MFNMFIFSHCCLSKVSSLIICGGFCCQDLNEMILQTFHLEQLAAIFHLQSLSSDYRCNCWWVRAVAMETVVSGSVTRHVGGLDEALNTMWYRKDVDAVETTKSKQTPDQLVTVQCTDQHATGAGGQTVWFTSAAGPRSELSCNTEPVVCSRVI